MAQERRKTIGQLFAVGFHGTEVDDNIRSLIRDYGVGAIVLFKHNIRDAAQLRELCLGLQTIAKEAGHDQPLFVGIDQENGLVTRIGPPIAAQLPGPMSLGAAGSLDSAYAVAKATGEILGHFGINMNYAPVGDINSEPLNPVIGVRSPGDDPEKVSQFAAACARGLRDCQVAPCIKHFPGHGDTAVDSHYGLPVIHKSRADLEKTELVPFRHAAAEGIEMVMTAHISLPGLAGSKLPATLSPEAIGILRNDMEYGGLIMTDCLEMDGVRATSGTVEGSLMAFQAGVDNVMICHTYEVQTAAIDRICQAIESGEISQQRIDASLDRLRKLKSRFTSWDVALQSQTPDSLSTINKEAEILAARVYQDATTLVRSQTGLLPLSRTAKTVFVSPGPNIPIGGAVGSGDAVLPTRVPWVKSSFGDALRRYNPSVVDIRFTDSTLSDDQWRQVDDADVVILATRNARESQYQKDLGMELARRRGESPLVAIATCNPYDFLEDRAMRTYLAVYEPTVEAFQSGVNIMYGEATARGRLPIAASQA
ncbi:Beta-hexosaminidase [Tolypocladium paradoxum]|uniref:Beta-hexosaminidase n=1 Tax=Tolypocladium paradoxum TaxID=94208 RepID=A0A2S4L1I8_9HYPO|nr:Beta-hexosaminidase [Tolypocladium paradoxum]